jgi:hypothetical protein
MNDLIFLKLQKKLKADFFRGETVEYLSDDSWTVLHVLLKQFTARDFFQFVSELSSPEKYPKN